MEITLGKTYKDILTGFKGVATGYCVYLTGCNSALLVPRCKEDNQKLSGEWIDVDRLELVVDTPAVCLKQTVSGGDILPPSK